MANARRLAAATGATILTLGIAGSAFAGSQVSTGPGRQLGAAERVCGIEPLDVELIIDNSGSMGSNSSGGKTRLEWAKLSAKQLVDDLDGSGIDVGGSGHHVGITRFSGSSASVIQSLDESDDDADAVKDAIDSMGSSGNTPLDEGMDEGADDLNDNGRSGVKKVVIILSDGRPWPDQGPEGDWAEWDFWARPTESEGNAYLASADVAISIALGSGGSNGTANEVDLGLMALLGPDGAYNVVSGGELPNVFSSIYEQIACPAELSAEKQVDKSLANPGDTLNYTITLTNNGGSDAEGVEVHDDISALLAHGTFGSCDNGCTNDADSVDWTGLSVPMGGTLELQFSIDLAADGWPVGSTHLPNTVVVPDTNCHGQAQSAKCQTDTEVIVEEPSFEQSQAPETAEPSFEQSQAPETEEPSFEQSQAAETDEPSFEQSQAAETDGPTLPDTAMGNPLGTPSTDGAWGLIVALAALVGSILVITPRSSRRRR